MLKKIRNFPAFIRVCAVLCVCMASALAQTSLADFHKVLRDKVAFDETAFAALSQGQTVVQLLPVQDKREVAVCGLVGVDVPAEIFLASFRDSMARKTNPAILEIGSFSRTPTLDDMSGLTMESRDLEDLKACIVGDCRLKLSAAMIERFQKEVNWQSPDYRIQATQLFRQMLLDYVRDYLARGDSALIEYNDKSKSVRIAEEQHALMNAPGYVNSFLSRLPQHQKGVSAADLHVIENAIVWSKIKFGLKPVLAINHITIYKREQGSGPQILIASKQIYANHYFDSSLALTAFVNIPGASPGSYLVYENRSRADGLDGAFSGIKRGIVEDRTVDGLKTILENSKVSLTARALNLSEPTQPTEVKRSWRRWKLGGVHVFAWLSLITTFVALFSIGSYSWKRGIIRGAHS
ncbi:MAG: hypothetical protein ABR501_01525 [Pyrinomonadaceae bacterium]